MPFYCSVVISVKDAESSCCHACGIDSHNSMEAGKNLKAFALKAIVVEKANKKRQLRKISSCKTTV